MKDEIRIRLSVGLIAVAVVHAVLLGVVLTALHQTPVTQDCGNETCRDEWNVPRSPQRTPSVIEIQKLPEPPRVNYETQGEMKQQIRCFPNRSVVRPTWNRTYPVAYTQVLPPTTVISQGTVVLKPVAPAPQSSKPVEPLG